MERRRRRIQLRLDIVKSVFIWVGVVWYYSNLRHRGVGRPRWISSSAINVLQNETGRESETQRGYKQVRDRTGRWHKQKEYLSRRTQPASTLYPHRQILRKSPQLFPLPLMWCVQGKNFPIKLWTGARGASKNRTPSSQCHNSTRVSRHFTDSKAKIIFHPNGNEKWVTNSITIFSYFVLSICFWTVLSQKYELFQLPTHNEKSAVIERGETIT